MSEAPPLAEEWVTIAEAARRLEVDQRQIRRYLPRMTDADTRQDTTRTRTGQPLYLVRMSALEAIRSASPVVNREVEASVSEGIDADTHNGQRTGHVTDRGQDTAPDEPDMSASENRAKLADALRRAEVAEAQAALLTAALEREKVATAREASLLDAEREAHREARVLHQNTQRLMEDLKTRADALALENQMLRSLPATPVAAPVASAETETGQGTAQSGTDSASIGDRGAVLGPDADGGTTAGELRDKTDPDDEAAVSAPRRLWWQRLFERG